MAGGGTGWRKPWHSMVTIALVAVFFSMAGFVAYLLYGPGISVVVPAFFGGRAATTTAETVVSAPSPQVASKTVSLENEPGSFFACENGKTLKAAFLETSARLALSDGRILTLPRVVAEDGEIRYENTDGSFAFLNTENTVFVEENDVVTYRNCTAGN